MSIDQYTLAEFEGQERGVELLLVHLLKDAV